VLLVQARVVADAPRVAVGVGLAQAVAFAVPGEARDAPERP